MQRLLNNTFRVLLTFLCVQFCFSQTSYFEGRLVDSSGTNGIKNAKIILVNIDDSVIVSHKTTDENGRFVFSNFLLNHFRIIMDHPKYERREFLFLDDTSEEKYIIDNILMVDKGKQIEEITIFAYRDPVYYKGDTLVYVADSFKTRPNAVVEDLLKKLPGFTVDANGKIKSQGKEIARVYVDGDEFFGSDATLATKNISASSVQTVNVYEKQLDGSESGDEKVQVIDLKLKEEAKKGYFGRATFATDFDRYYDGQTIGNYFNKKMKVSAFFLTGNTPKAVISGNDSYKFGIEGEQAYRYDSETDSWDINSNFIRTDDGFPLLFKTGVYFTDHVTEKLKIGANYTYSDVRKLTKYTAKESYFFEDTTFFVNTSRNNYMTYKSHEANLIFEYEIDSTQKISFTPTFLINEKSESRQNASDFINQNYISQRSSLFNTDRSSDGLNFKGRLNYEKKFNKKNRGLKIFNNFIYDTYSDETLLSTADYFSNSPIPQNQINQLKVGDRKIISNIFNVTYTEPLGTKFKLEINYELFNTKNDYSLFSNDLQDGFTAILDSLTSGILRSDKIQNRLGLNLVYKFRKHTFTVGAHYRNVLVENANFLNDSQINQNVNNLFPRITYHFAKSTSERLNVQFTTNSSLPTINQLIPLRDNSNPNSITTGNTNLLPNYRLYFSIFYNKWNSITGNYLYLGGSANYTFKEYLYSINYDNLGRAIETFENLNTFSSSYIYFGYGFNFFKQVLNVEPNLSFGYNQTASKVNGVLSPLSYLNVNPGISSTLNFDFIELSAGYDFTYNSNRSLNSDQVKVNMSIHEISTDMKIFLPWKMELMFSSRHYCRLNFSDEYNVNNHILNSSITQKFGKNENFQISLEANDLLNQNTKIARNAYGNMVTDSRNAIISRYWMLRFTYLFNSTFKKSKEASNEE